MFVIIILCLCCVFDTDLFHVQLLYDSYWTLEMYMFVYIIMHFCLCHFDYIHLQSLHAPISPMVYRYETRHNAKDIIIYKKVLY